MSLAKPKIVPPGMPRNELGLTRRDYEGGMSTLCAGCGHDSVTAAIVQACFELSLQPQSVAKLSGIGCSSAGSSMIVPSRSMNKVGCGVVMPPYPSLAVIAVPDGSILIF